jgi:hypothetical protein
VAYYLLKKVNWLKAQEAREEARAKVLAERALEPQESYNSILKSNIEKSTKSTITGNCSRGSTVTKKSSSGSSYPKFHIGCEIQLNQIYSKGLIILNKRLVKVADKGLASKAD